MAYARLIRQSASLHAQLELSRNLGNSQYRKIRVIFQSKRLETRKELLIQSGIFDRSNYLSHQSSLISSLAVFFIQILSFASREFMEVLFLNLSFSCLYPGFSFQSKRIKLKRKELFEYCYILGKRTTKI